MTETYKIAILGAATIRGKELNEALAESTFAGADFSLMDDESQLGQLEAVGDEVTFIQRVEPSAFDRTDFVFFAGSEDVTRKHWKAAQKAGASIVDLSYALESEPGVLVLAPWLDEAGGSGSELNLSTPAVIPAHPVSVALGPDAGSVAGVRCDQKCFGYRAWSLRQNMGMLPWTNCISRRWDC